MRYFSNVIIIAFLASAVYLSGCGIKPAQVDPPQGEENDNFPRSYPDLSTDPRP